jgi:type IV pilus assembly protein PilB
MSYQAQSSSLPPPAPTRSRLGEILLADGRITQNQLDTALEQQKERRLPLGQILTKLHYVTDEVMRQALGRQLNIPYVDLENMVIDRDLARTINRGYAKRHALVPVARSGTLLTVVMDDPSARAVVDDLARMTHYTITVVTASSRSIQRAFRRLYDAPEDQPETAATVIDTPESTDESATIDEAASKRADELFRFLLARAIDAGCSDIHLETLPSGLHIRFRIDGVLRRPQFGDVQHAFDQIRREVASRVKILAKLDIAERRRPQDGSFQASVDRNGSKIPIDLRVSVLPTYFGESIVIRILNRSRAGRALSDLDLSPSVLTRLNDVLKRTAGIFLVTGPTGSGKSTTLYSCLMKLQRPEIRILTAEDPVEYVYDEVSQSEVNDQIGNTFASYLRSFLRHDPEVIMVGEIRDEATAEMAFRAAQTGHLLLSTLHTENALAALPRLLDLEVESSLIGSSLIGVMSQRLVRRVCDACREPFTPPAELVAEFFTAVPSDMTFTHGAGCAVCGHSGYKGRALLVDLWVPDDQDLRLVTQRAPLDEIAASASRTMLSMAQNANERLRAGRTTLEELLRVLPYATVIEHRRRFSATG